MKPHVRRNEYTDLTPEQAAALAEFDRSINAATDEERPRLMVPAVLGPRYGGGLRLQGLGRRQLRALRDLHRAQERALGRDPRAARAYLHPPNDESKTE